MKELWEIKSLIFAAILYGWTNAGPWPSYRVLKKFYLECSHTHSFPLCPWLLSSYSGLKAIGKLSSYDKSHMSHKAQNIHSLAFMIKGCWPLYWCVPWKSEEINYATLSTRVWESRDNMSKLKPVAVLAIIIIQNKGKDLS